MSGDTLLELRVANAEETLAGLASRVDDLRRDVKTVEAQVAVQAHDLKATQAAVAEIAIDTRATRHDVAKFGSWTRMILTAFAGAGGGIAYGMTQAIITVWLGKGTP